MIKYFISADLNNPDRPCKPVDVINDLIDRVKFRSALEFINKKIPHGGGNCHQVAGAIIVALIKTGNAKGWTWVKGYIDYGEYGWQHSWLEYDGWAIDASSLQKHLCKDAIPILICDALYYREYYEFQAITQLNVTQIKKKWIYLLHSFFISSTEKTVNLENELIKTVRGDL